MRLVDAWRRKERAQKAVRPVLDLWRAGAGPVAGSGRALPRHSRDTAYGCSLPGLTGFTAPGRAGPDHQRCLPGAARSSSGRRRVLSPACRGFPVQGTPSPPPSTASQRIAAARLLPTLGLGRAEMAISYAMVELTAIWGRWWLGLRYWWWVNAPSQKLPWGDR